MQRFVDELKKYKGLTLPMALRLTNICGDMVKAGTTGDPVSNAVDFEVELNNLKYDYENLKRYKGGEP